MKTRLLFLYLLLAVQAVGLGALYEYHAVGRDAKWRLLLEAAPVDPRDVFRGDYIILSYAGLSTSATSSDPKGSEEYGERYVTVQQRGKYWIIDHILNRPPDDGRPFLRAQIDGYQLEYGLERYYVPEGKGRPPGKITVEVAVRADGSAQIRQVFNDGMPWP